MGTLGKAAGVGGAFVAAHAETAKENCPVSQALAVEISVDATLTSS
jgi:organic hydroperoxide reductase OsmC/OhrA